MHTDLWGAPLPEPAPTPAPAPPLTLEQRWAREDTRRKQRAAERRAAGNPLLPVYGPDPAGRTCAGCTHLLHLRYNGRTYHKCGLRGVPTHGEGTDHRVLWPACARFEVAPGTE